MVSPPGEKDKKESEEAKREGDNRAEANDEEQRERGEVAGGLKTLVWEPPAWRAGRASTAFILSLRANKGQLNHRISQEIKIPSTPLGPRVEKLTTC